MQPNLPFFLLFSFMIVHAHAQEAPSPAIRLGDPVPPLRAREWLKGTPVLQFEKGKVYVLEFWATWCVPCRAAMPHLSALAHEYKDKVAFIGVDIREMKRTPLEKVKAFVDSIGPQMDYTVAVEESSKAVDGLLEATGEQDMGIPRTLVVNAEGKLAWTGHPKDLAPVLPHIVDKSWNIPEFSDKKKLDKHLAKLDGDATDELMQFDGNFQKEDYIGQPDSALILISRIVEKEPGLKYAPRLASYTFTALLKTDPLKAYEYGEEVLTHPTYEEPAFDAIIYCVEMYSTLLKLPPAIYRLAAEAYQAEIDHIPYPEIMDMVKLYSGMAEMYGRANEKAKAVAAQQKAIETLKSKNAERVAAFELRLQAFKN